MMALFSWDGAFDGMYTGNVHVIEGKGEVIGEGRCRFGEVVVEVIGTAVRAGA